MSKELTTTDTKQSILTRFGQKYNVEPNKVGETLAKTAFKECQNPEQMISLLIVADQYGLNPFTNEITAFPSKEKGIVPLVGIDGWSRIINDHPEYDGMELRYADELIAAHKDCTRSAPEWVECSIYRKDRDRPQTVREYLVENYRNTGPWNQAPARMLRHRAIIQCARIAFGFTGIVDPNDAELALENPIEPEPERTITIVGAAGWDELRLRAGAVGITDDELALTAQVLGVDDVETLTAEQYDQIANALHQLAQAEGES